MPHSLLLLVAYLIREDIILLEAIWPYFQKQVREDGKFRDTDDEVLIYHENMLRVLVHKYEQLDMKILDKEQADKENQEIN